MASYHYTFGVYESNMVEDEEDLFTTVKMHLWKKLEDESSSSSAPAVELVNVIECCYVNPAAENDVKELSNCLGQIGVPQECHARMIAELIRYIESEVNADGRRRYESEMVVMDIYDASDINEVFPRFVEFSPRVWYYMDLGVYESWAWPEEAAEGDIAQAVEILRVIFERSTNNVTVERSLRDDDVVSQSMEEYAAKMVPASEAAIASLEKVDQQGEVALCCVICMHQDEDEDEDGDGDEKLGFSRMPCKHEFHTLCIQTWLRISSYCPLCRFIMLT